MRSVEQMMTYLMMTSDPIRELLVDEVTNTDDMPIVEFNAPKYLYSTTTQDNIRMLFGERSSGEFELPVSNLTAPEGYWIAIPFMGVRVYGHPDTISEPEWNVVKRLADSEDAESSALASGMNGEVSLRKSWGEVTIRTTMVSRGPAVTQVVFPMLNEELAENDDTLAGELKIEDEVIFWRAGPAQQPGSIKVVAARRCERASEYDNFNIISSVMPGDASNFEQVGFAVQQIASIMECLEEPIDQVMSR